MRFELELGGGYITWCFAKDIDQAGNYAVNRYRTKSNPNCSIKVKGPLPKGYDYYDAPNKEQIPVKEF